MIEPEVTQAAPPQGEIAEALLQPIPRKVRYKWMMRFSFAVFSFLIFLQLASFYSINLERGWLRSDTTKVFATVIEKHEVKRGKYSVKYEFSTSMGSFVDSINVKRDEYASLEVGSSLPEVISYATKEPRVHYVRDPEEAFSRTWGLIRLCQVFCLIIGPGLFLARREAALLKRGIVATGVVLEVKSVLRGITVKYIYRANGETLHGSQFTWTRQVLAATRDGHISVGTQLTILHDEKDPKRSRPYMMFRQARIKNPVLY